jgi:hypothetical protein
MVFFFIVLVVIPLTRRLPLKETKRQFKKPLKVLWKRYCSYFGQQERQGLTTLRDSLLVIVVFERVEELLHDFVEKSRRVGVQCIPPAGLGFRVQGSGFRVQGSGFRV